MKINSKTKISAIINHNPDAIEALVSVNTHFSKLRNPLLRRIVAPRVTVEDAAGVGKCSVDEILKKLSTIGFEIEKPFKEKEIVRAETQDKNIFEQINAGKIIVLDVRPILKAGFDPFNRIMEELKIVPDGFALEVINSFEPTPLIKILSGKGYVSFVKMIDETVHTYFLKISSAGVMKPGTGRKVSQAEMEIIKEKFKNNIVELDVRDLEMPLPMVTILNELENLKKGNALFVHHKKIPQLLLPELEERNFFVAMLEMEEGNVKLLIHK